MIRQARHDERQPEAHTDRDEERNCIGDMPPHRIDDDVAHVLMEKVERVGHKAN